MQLGSTSIGVPPTGTTDAQWVADPTAGKMYCEDEPSSPAVKHAAGDCVGSGGTCYSDERVWGFHSNAQGCSALSSTTAKTCYDAAAALQLEVTLGNKFSISPCLRPPTSKASA